MTTKNPTTKKASKAPVTTVREGAIGASIFLSQSMDGNQSHYYVMSRCWKPEGSDEFKYTNRLYPRNSGAVAKVATMAANKCAELDRAINHDGTANEVKAVQ